MGRMCKQIPIGSGTGGVELRYRLNRGTKMYARWRGPEGLIERKAEAIRVHRASYTRWVRSLGSTVFGI